VVRTDAYEGKPLPKVITPEESLAVLGQLKGVHQLIGYLLYGSGLRMNEALSLRVKDIDFYNQSIFVFQGKGKKDRTALTSGCLIEQFKVLIQTVKGIHDDDLDNG
jgi:integrase